MPHGILTESKNFPTTVQGVQSVFTAKPSSVNYFENASKKNLKGHFEMIASIGSVAEEVVRIASCPVLTVHPKGHQFLSDMTTMQSSSARR